MTRFALVLALVAAACSAPPKVRTQHDDSYSFAGKKTFAWLPLKDSGDARIDDEFLAKNVRGMVQRTLENKGYELVESGAADFLVGHDAVVIEQRGASDDLGTDYGTYTTHSSTPEYTYYAATLILEMKDGAGGPVVWKASAQAALFTKARKDERRRTTQDAVRRMLEEFPPE